MTKQMATIINELAKYSQTAGYVYKTEDSVYTANGYAIIIEAHTDNVLAVVYDKATDSLYKSVLTMLQAAKADGHQYIKVVGWKRWSIFIRKLPSFSGIMADRDNDTAYINLEKL